MKKIRSSARLPLVCVFAIMLATPVHAQVTIASSTNDGYLLQDTFSRWARTATDHTRTSSYNGSTFTSSNTFQGDPTTLTWGFVADGTTVNDKSSNLIAKLDATFGSGPGDSNLALRPWFGHFESSYNRWGEVSGLTFHYEANDDGPDISGNVNSGTWGIVGTRADMRIGGASNDGVFNVIGSNYFPNGGDMDIDTDDFGTGGAFLISTNNYLVMRQMIMHEVGHGLGITHWESSNSNALLEPFLSTSFEGPQHGDILAVQRAYGDKFESNGGNNTAATATALGDVTTFTGIGFDGDNSTVAFTDVDFVSIDGLTDTDFYSITLDQDGEFDAILQSLGLQYDIREQGAPAPGTSVDTSALNNLALALFGIDGTTLIASSNSAAAGGTESILGQMLSAGTYFLRVNGSDDRAQFYSLTTNFTPVPEPAASVLLILSSVALFVRRRRY